jgi:hypothetical protein
VTGTLADRVVAHAELLEPSQMVGAQRVRVRQGPGDAGGAQVLGDQVLQGVG